MNDISTEDRLNISSIVMLMRPYQYIKNFFIFLPLFFASKITDLPLLFDTFIAFLAFSITASSIYILNDYHDIEEDKLHPRKAKRPLSSGKISKPQALLIMLMLLTAGSILMAWVSYKALAILLVYVLSNIVYTVYLKHVAILDVTIIAIGFVLRLFVGSAATDIPLSMWIVIMTFLLALFLALAKRRDDVIIYLDTGKKMRKAVDGYNLQFLDAALAIMSSVTIVSYTIYTTTEEVIERIQNDHLYLTSLFVIIGIMRYLQITFVEKESGSPTHIVMNDRFIQLTLLGWLATFAWMLY
ncbi:UbiA prenyltransferase family protein [Thiolapillus brandeum]|uniref:UbiA prenyltransferase family protein n=1 Tax=Thiolapillus brandeum TaxID=1076588 RepID=A0A7U6GKG7_9GAMM|nr:UbiA prenyltransferase family protein [Thiolapillus brandeum]BAO45316.1 UbiA prenyltransferase family protein [Thiolapillus brandeum]